MILGVGTDIVKIARIASDIEKFSDRFLQHCFTDYELNYAKQKKALLPSTLAKRFAGKEAVSKALGVGIAKGITLKDIEIRNDENGMPYVVLYNEALKFLEKKAKSDTLPKVYISLADEEDYALAYVIIETLA